MWHVWGRVTCKILWGYLEVRDHFEDLGVDVGIILKYIFKCLSSSVLDRWWAVVDTVMELEKMGIC
jgi:hypothetical protein